MQDADLVAIIQIVVYASAIVVLFLFVITLLGVDQHESFDEPRRFQRPLAIVLGVLLLVQVIVARRRRLGHRCAVRDRDRSSEPATGNVETLAEALFTDYIWAFEITAVLLVIAVVGGVVLARRSGHRPAQPRRRRVRTMQPRCRALGAIGAVEITPTYYLILAAIALHDRRRRAAACAATRS